MISMCTSHFLASFWQILVHVFFGLFRELLIDFVGGRGGFGRKSSGKLR